MNKLEVMKVTMEIEGLEEEYCKHQSTIEETEREGNNREIQRPRI